MGNATLFDKDRIGSVASIFRFGCGVWKGFVIGCSRHCEAGGSTGLVSLGRHGEAGGLATASSQFEVHDIILQFNGAGLVRLFQWGGVSGSIFHGAGLMGLFSMGRG
jgi:hypothetical protein